MLLSSGFCAHMHIGLTLVVYYPLFSSWFVSVPPVGKIEEAAYGSFCLNWGGEVLILAGVLLISAFSLRNSKTLDDVLSQSRRYTGCILIPFGVLKWILLMIFYAGNRFEYFLLNK